MARASKVVAVESLHAVGDGLVVGTLAEVTPDGVPFVRLPGIAKPLQAKVLAQSTAAGQVPGAEVLVHCSSDSRVVVIVGFLRESFDRSKQPSGREAAGVLPSQDGAIDAKVDGRTVTLRAEREIVLECGKSMVLLKQDGTIILRGVKITSRALRSNKIKGASVNIN